MFTCYTIMVRIWKHFRNNTIIIDFGLNKLLWKYQKFSVFCLFKCLKMSSPFKFFIGLFVLILTNLGSLDNATRSRIHLNNNIWLSSRTNCEEICRAKMCVVCGFALVCTVLYFGIVSKLDVLMIKMFTAVKNVVHDNGAVLRRKANHHLSDGDRCEIRYEPHDDDTRTVSSNLAASRRTRTRHL